MTLQKNLVSGLLIGMSVALISFSSVASAGDPAMAARKQHQMKIIMKHVTPMPGLMGVAKKYSNELGLNDDQKAKMALWFDKQGPVVGKKARKVIDTEAAITAAVLAGEGPEKINELAKEALETRQSIIDTKLKCRDNLKKIMTEEQWNKLIEIAKKTDA